MKNLWLVMGFLVSTLTGCGLFATDPLEYTRAKESKSLTLPEDKRKNSIVDYYVLPPLSQSGQAKPVGDQLNQFAPFSVIAVGNDVRSVYDSKDAAVWIEQSFEDISEDIVSYLGTINLTQKKSTAKGEVNFNTQWYEQEYDQRVDPVLGEEIERVRNRFHWVLKPSERNKEIMLKVSIVDSAYLDENNQWRSTKAGSNYREYQLLNDFLSQRHELAKGSNRGSDFYKQSIKIALATAEDNQAVFHSSAPLRRTWLKLGQVLEKLGLEVEDKDPSDGLYVASFDYEHQFGAFDWLFGQKKNILELPSGNYRFIVKSLGRSSEIRVLDSDGKNLSAEQLTKIQPQISAEFKKK